jgi:hypothetical protein
VIDLKWTHLGFAFSDAGVSGAIVSHKNNVVDEINRVVLSKGTTGAEPL